ncbi:MULTISPECIES: beta-ketoacyl-ACP synthase I [Thalassolituus]|jgi:3-oxoacyl-[acyl-carrier-protein] synthase-1|uniref:beta-ketoacyl-ACP synthase I n=1 Tax=Thalassolituus TaxID=187492 RepID=UPI000C621502|nr:MULTISPECIES: beta-ketoacyl-ACP synthase I [Thalassolituus]MAX85962.1 beta-ketoacyl-[acyl-carrier-protein] synthase I [Oceanospirillaceae bacterium]MEC8908038.1 beta-ketoacyl-ACP synthase I [Pseudomonadota bacterium]HCG80231.1 beta-ketoacyl-ACP synthase I [Oceanospirillales bacterium]MEC9410401.1 beta-ketoacyl-ACP synthase I [Pseudomonadota bacterium]MED5439907.1 beta-ketoacyl-ACP synthase I [Pseudomonadota bacterium]|tara:strand:+ start:660 stop:1871 length:1212 start_codon:yes stop_codon:yes gene_type:complete
MRRVVITGLGIVSCIGNNKEEVLTSLRGQTSGIRYIPEYEDAGFRSHIAGRPQINPDDHIDRKQRRFMGDSAAYSYIALKEAIADAGLSEDMVSSPRTGLIAGSGGASSSDIVEAVDTLREKGIRRVGPYRVTRSMGSTVSANLATPFSIRGVNYSITSACATSAHCIGNAMELIQWGKQDIMFAGGGEEEHWTLTMQFDAMGALSTKYNDTPDKASRPYDATRDGFVIAGGAGMVVLEEYEHAVKRGATIYAEIIGYGATSDGADMVAPSGEGAERCMRDALEMAGNPNIDYLNTHGTSTPAGDICELDAVKRAFSGNVPPFSSTKSLTGHSLGAAGVQEAIYCLLMQKDGFITGSANVTERDPGAADVPLVTENRDASLTTIMSNSFGFGGTNATLVFKKV